MSKVSALRKLGVVARVAGQQAGRSRTLRALLGAARTTLVSLGRVLHQLWLEVVGLLFLTLAAFGGIALVREYAKYQSGQANASRVAVAIGFTAMFTWFGLSSFWRVRRKSQRP